MNMTLDGLETKLAEQFPTAKRKGLKMNMVRYADDFIITGNSKEWLELEVKPVVVEFLAERGLVLSPEKTKITHIVEGFDFLGWNFRKYNGKLLMKPSKANVKGHLGKIREVVKANKTSKQADLIRLLNPILRGWANYHSHVVAKVTFSRVDSMVWSMLWRWAVRRHPNKGRRWVKKKYFKSQGTRNWVFSRNRKKKKMEQRRSAPCCWNPIRQLCGTSRSKRQLIRTTCNGNRISKPGGSRKCGTPGRGRSKLYRVWLGQDCNCHDCHQPITKSTPWAFRHIVKRPDGGTDAASNLQMHHLNCHRRQQAEKEVV